MRRLKQTMTIMHNSFIFRTVIFTLLLLGYTSLLSSAQSIQRETYNKTLLQLSSSFITVSKEARIDLDSSLVLTAQRHQLSRVPIISEDIDESYARRNCSWMDGGDPSIAKKELTKLRGVQHTRLLLLIGAYYAFHAGFSARYIDSGISFLSRAQKECKALQLENWSAQSSILLEKCFLKAGNIDSGQYYLKQTTFKTPTPANLKTYAKAYYYYGLYCPYLPRTTSLRIHNLELAFKAYTQLGNKANQINTLMDLAYLNFANKNIKLAQSSALRSLALQRAIQFPFTHYTTDFLALISSLGGDYSNELTYALESVKTAENTRDDLGAAVFYQRLGDCYTASRSTRAESILWYQRALIQFQKYGGDSQVYRLMIYLASEKLNFASSSYMAQAVKKLLSAPQPLNTIDQQDADLALGECYRALKQYHKSEQYFLMAEKLEKPNELIRGDVKKTVVDYLLGRFYFESQNLIRSKQYLLKVINSPDSRLNSPDNRLHSYKLLYRIDSAAGNYRSSMYYLQRYKSLSDTLQHIAENRNVQLDNSAARDNGPSANKRLIQLSLLMSIGLTLLITLILYLTIRYLINSRKNKREGAITINEVNEFDQQQDLIRHAVEEKEKLLLEKEKLLSEIHHRAKYNLQIVIDLLGNQSAYLDNELALEAIGESQNRMKAMSLIHQQLDISESASQVEISGYIITMVDYLTEHFNVGDKITFDLKLQPLILDLTKAVPLGLLLNEIISNCIKHAFPGRTDGIVQIVLRNFDDDVILIDIKDNGVGLPAGLDIDESPSLGIRLIRGLGNQLDADLQFLNQNGLAVEIGFER